MLTIRHEQMEVFSLYLRNQFEQRMVRHLQATFPDRVKHLPDDKLLKAVQQGIAKANGYEVNYENDIRRFLEYMVIYGLTLDSKPETEWIAAILNRQDIDGTVKMDLIDDHDLMRRTRS